ncbi:hypothetical protein TEA_007091 [Camellia sinensis var. sinensis]|uniref:RRM domain-containing protein n=1 Tax=Camellia sinensis var. sinensis TaxID=542762 RepID=A0A4S4CZ69_CAMSN|nr:hypothetical protein TEA_007091 [Camellia sinensis var. sinensis]
MMQPATSVVQPHQQNHLQYQQQSWMIKQQMYYHQQQPPQAAATAVQQPHCFAHTGEVVSATVIRNKQTSQSEGYGFIEFANHPAAERALQTYNGTQMPNIEQNYRLNWASFGTGKKRQDTTHDYTIFVGDLASDVTDDMLQETFRPHYPSVKGAKVVTDRMTGRTKGYGFVSGFSASASASVYKDHDEEADTRIMRRSALDDTLARLFDGTPFMEWAHLLMACLLTDWAHLLRVRLFQRSDMTP